MSPGTGAENFSPEELKKCLNEISETSTTNLELSGINLSAFPPDIFSGLANSLVQRLNLYGTNVNIYNQEIFSIIPRLRHLELVFCNLNETHLWHSDTLENLSLMNNRLTSFPRFCVDDKPVFLNLTFLDFSFNFLTTLKPSDINCLKRLTSLNIDRNPLFVIKNNTFVDLPTLKTLSLSGIRSVYFTIESRAFNSKSLTELDFSNQILDWSRVNMNLLTLCPNLEVLLLSGNSLATFNEADFYTFLSPLKNLKDIDLDVTGLGYLPRVISQNLTHLEKLHADRNEISSWPDDYFTSLTNLRELGLTGNLIQIIYKKSISESLIARLELIGLEGNPFVCSCQLLWFISLLEHTMFKDNLLEKYKFRGYPERYLCDAPLKWKGKQISSTPISERFCFLPSPIAISLISAVSSLVLFVLCGSFVFRYRWHFKYAAYMLRFQHRRFQRLAEKGDNYKFDVYVSCSEDNLDLVLDEIVPKLEQEMGLRLFIPERDGIGNKIDVILLNMDASRRSILFISNSYARDHFCEFEATLAYERYLHEKQTV
ncbi:toll-like receptor 7 [Patella vulgata]|uniref:toll-like receptor 7 n=1 Tax=Patella vulgata TaxID=6465 RepID=UPI0024A8B8DD|nr:toll-like receptor 7 [Patella vulgata]